MTPDPVPVRPAATVMLLRDGTAGLEVFVIRRVTAMAFAGGMTAFPGGAVDPSDRSPVPDARRWAALLGVDDDLAGALVTAAVRELFEETGVLLASVGAGTRPAVSEQDRLAVTGHQRSLAQLLGGSGRVMLDDLLVPWGRWITPDGHPRRYDTFFFAAAAPDGQHPRSVTTEADRGGWARPAGLLDEARQGLVALMPPTRAMLTDLAGMANVRSALTAQRSLGAVRPRVVSSRGEPVRVAYDLPGRTVLDPPEGTA